MHVLSRCPHCDQTVRLPEEAVGRSGRCPRCQGSFVATIDAGPSSGAGSGSVAGASASASAARTGPASGPGASASAVGSAGSTSTGSTTGPGRSSRKGADEPTIGKIGRFELKAALGAGAFGRVYRAFDPVLDRQVALKVPRFPPDEPALVERFFREARAAARLRHPNLVAVHESGRDGDDYYIASEFVPGVPLSVRLADDPPDVRASARFVRDLARGLAYAHDEGVVHRDIKPANVMIGKGDRPQLMDFGLAKRVDDDASMTSEGSVMGTPAYMSPEQAKGDVKAVGPRSDLYSLGVVLYELLTGRKPFEGPSHSVIARVVGEEPPAPRKVRAGVPLDLEAVCLKAMEKDPARRYATAAGLAADLDRWLDGEPTEARPVGPVERLARWARKRPAVAGLAAAVFLASLAGTAVSSYFKVQADRRARDAERSAAEASRRREEAEAAGRKAEASAAEATRQLARFHVANGARALDAGDKFGALLSFALAWSIDGPDPAAEENHRLRFGAMLADVTPLVGLCLHDRPVRQAAFSPDGSRVLTRVDEGTAAYVWDPARARLACPPLDHGTAIRHACWSPDGAHVVTVAAGNLARVWDARTGRQVRRIRHPGRASWAAFDPKRGRLATACADGSVRFWDAAGGNEAAPAIAVGQPVEFVDFSPDGSKLVTATRDGKARIWAADGGKPLSPELPHPDLTGHDVNFGLKRRPVFSPDGRHLLTAGPKNWHAWDAASGNRVSGPNAVGGGDVIAQMLWRSNAQVVLCQSRPFLAVYNLDGTRAETVAYPRSVYRAAVGPGGQRLVNDMTGGTVFLRDLARPQLPAAWPQPVRCTDQTSDLAFSPDGNRCLVASVDGAVRVWWIHPGRPAAKPYAFDDGRACQVELESADQRVRTFHPGGRLEVRFRRRAPGPVELAERGGGVKFTLPHTAPLELARFGSDGGVLVTVQTDRTVRAWDPSTGRPAGPGFSIGGTSEPTFDESFSDDARRLAVRDRSAGSPRNGRLSVWDVTAGKRLFGPAAMPGDFPIVFTEEKDPGLLTRVAISPDGKVVAAVSESTGGLAFWEVDTGKLLHASPRRFTGLSAGLAFGPGGTRLIHYGSGQLVQVWRVPDAVPAGPPLRHATMISGRLSPPSGGRVATFEPVSGGILRVWDTATGDLLFRTSGPKAFGFGGDGRSLLIPDPTGSVTQVSLSHFKAPAAQVAPLVELITCQRLDKSAWFEPLDQFALRSDPARFRRAWLAWRGFDDDPEAQPGHSAR